MHLQRIFTLGLIALLIASGTAYAGVTGVIAGKIADADGNAIPGVTVSVYGAQLPGVRMDTTSATGTYRMPELPPGVYTVKAELMGMKTVERPNVKVSLNSTTRINVGMEMAPFEETVVVTGSSPVLDVKSTTVKATIERDVTERLPGSDSLFAAFSMAGGITGGGNVRVHGGSFTDNVYLFDGVDTTDPMTNTFGANLNADAIQEVEVQTGGFTAEYGRSMGGIVNAVTRSGGNDFHMIWREKYVNESWQADVDEDHSAYEGTSKYWDHTFTADGPILKDKLWWMFSVNYNKQEGTTKAIDGFGADWEAGETTDVSTDSEFLLPYFKLTYQINQDHKFVVNYSGEVATINGIGDGQYNSQETFRKQEQGGPFYSMEYTWLVNREFYVIGRAGVSLGYLNSTPYDTSGDPYFYDTYSQTGYNGSGSFSEDERSKYQGSIVGNYFLDDMMGSHEIKAGFEKHYLKTEDHTEFPGGPTYKINYDDWSYGDRNVPLAYTDPTHATDSSLSGHYFGFFLQDDWSVTDAITVNLGVRWEKSWFKNNDGETAVAAWAWGDWNASDYFSVDANGERDYKKSDMDMGNMIAPRIGVNWDIFGDGKLAARAYYGRFYNPFDLFIPWMFQPFSADVTASADQTYVGPDWNDADGDGVPDDDYFYDDANWETYRESQAGDTNFIDANIKPEYTDEISAGLQWEFMDNFSIGYQYTSRETRDIVEDVGLFFDEDGNVTWTYLGGVNWEDPDNPFFDGDNPHYDRDPLYDPDYETGEKEGTNEYYKHLYWVTNVDGKRSYWGHEINAVARMKHFDLQASYTYSQAKGVVIETQDNGGVGSTGVTQFSGQFDTPGTTDNVYGELPWSCRHYLKIAGSAHYQFFDFYELSFGVSGFIRSGYHYSKLTSPPWTYDHNDPTNDIDDPDSWTGIPPYISQKWYFMEPRGQNELPTVSIWDISIQNTIDTNKWFGKYGPSLTVIGDVFNVFDNQAVVSRTSTHNRNKPGKWGNDNGWASPRSYRVTLKVTI